MATPVPICIRSVAMAATDNGGKGPWAFSNATIPSKPADLRFTGGSFRRPQIVVWDVIDDTHAAYSLYTRFAVS